MSDMEAEGIPAIEDVDTEATEVAMETEDDAGLAAEDAAMHITDTP